MVLNATLLNTQYYKVSVKGKVEQSREWSCDPPLHLGQVAIEKEVFWSPSTKVANLTYFYTHTHTHIYIYSESESEQASERERGGEGERETFMHAYEVTG